MLRHHYQWQQLVSWNNWCQMAIWHVHLWHYAPPFWANLSPQLDTTRQSDSCAPPTHRWTQLTKLIAVHYPPVKGLQAICEHYRYMPLYRPVCTGCSQACYWNTYANWVGACQHIALNHKPLVNFTSASQLHAAQPPANFIWTGVPPTPLEQKARSAMAGSWA